MCGFLRPCPYGILHPLTLTATTTACTSSRTINRNPIQIVCIPADLHSTQDTLAVHVIEDSPQQSYLPSRSAFPGQKEKEKGRKKKGIILTHVQQGGGCDAIARIGSWVDVIEKFRGLLEALPRSRANPQAAALASENQCSPAEPLIYAVPSCRIRAPYICRYIYVGIYIYIYILYLRGRISHVIAHTLSLGIAVDSAGFPLLHVVINSEQYSAECLAMDLEQRLSLRIPRGAASSRSFRKVLTFYSGGRGRGSCGSGHTYSQPDPT